MVKIVVIGGGVAGLSTAYYLAKKGLNPIVLESCKQLGGLGFVYRVGDLFIDSAYHLVFKNDVFIMDLLKDLGLEKDIVWGSAEFRVVSESGRFSFSPYGILKGKAVSIMDKIRLARMYFKLKRLKDWKELDKLSAEEWIVENGSESLHENVFRPLIRAKWGNWEKEASAAWFFGRAKPSYESRNIIGGGEKIGYLKGSFHRMFVSMEKDIMKRGGKILKSVKAVKISIKNGRIENLVYTLRGCKKGIRPDIIVSTIPVPELLKIANLPADFRDKIEKIRYRAVICAVLGLKEKVTDSFRTVFKESKLLGGIVELTNLIEPKYFNGQHILYIFNFLDTKDGLWRMDKNKILERYISELERLYPGFKKNVKWSRVYKNRYGEPFYCKNYLDIMPEIRTPVKGLFITGIVQSYPVSDYSNIIGLGKKTSDIISDM